LVVIKKIHIINKFYFLDGCLYINGWKIQDRWIIVESKQDFIISILCICIFIFINGLNMFAHLHGHSTFSFLEAIGKPKQIIAKAKSL
jgi:hypothetical protein